MENNERGRVHKIFNLPVDIAARLETMAFEQKRSQVDIVAEILDGNLPPLKKNGNGNKK